MRAFVWRCRMSGMITSTKKAPAATEITGQTFPRSRLFMLPPGVEWPFHRRLGGSFLQLLNRTFGLRFPDDANPTQDWRDRLRSEEHTSELQSHSFISYAVFC